MNNSDPSESDLAWRGYSGWAMLPSFTVCILLSVVLLTSRWFIEDVRGIGEKIGSLVFFWITWAIWGIQILRWLYRGASYVYRLTPKHLFIDRGFLHSPELPIALASVTRVEVGSNLLARFFNAGWVCVFVERREPVCMSGLLFPEQFAREIEAAIKNARAPLAT